MERLQGVFAPCYSTTMKRAFLSIKNSYPTLVEVAPGDYRAVWDSGTPDKTRTHIHFGKIKIKP